MYKNYKSKLEKIFFHHKYHKELNNSCIYILDKVVKKETPTGQVLVRRNKPVRDDSTKQGPQTEKDHFQSTTSSKKNLDL